MISGFDIIGNIIIVEIPEHLKNKKKQIVRFLLEKNKYCQSVYAKVSERSGKYRTYKLKLLYGKDNPVTIHKESGLRIKLDVKKCYFSPRLSTERFRIANLVKPRESVLVMFSGVAPYPLIIAKHSKAKEITGIELNPFAHKFAKENVLLNKLQDKITLLKGDVKKVIPKLKKKFDRIIMPLPKTSENFLPSAFMACKKSCIIHFYCFAKEDEFDLAKKNILNLCKTINVKCKILRVVKSGQTSPRTYRICIDFKVNI